MLRDFWLLSDLDGTLISTPHKAKGKYLPITSSPCLEPLKRWLGHGGNVCVVTTADTRVLDQLYFPLRAFLTNCRLSVFKSAAEEEKCTQCGTLLLSLYTGAVLYRCTADEVVMVPRYIHRFHRATEESTIQSQRYGVDQPKITFREDIHGDPNRVCTEEAVEGTCITGDTGEEVRQLVCSLYLTYTEDILLAKTSVISKIQHLSRRYKTMWRSFLTLLQEVYAAETHQPSSGGTVDPFKPDTYRAASPAELTWKMNYLRSRSLLLRSLGILRIEFAQEIPFRDGSRDAQRDGSRAKAAVLIKNMLLNGISEAERLERCAQQFAEKVTELLGVEDKELERAASVSQRRTSKDDSIAQMILLGFPLSLYSTYFVEHLPALIKAGVHCMPQPNSVVFSKLGVSKSTALRYVLGKCVGNNDSTSAGAETFVGVVRADSSVALGDNPQSTDFELTVFPDVFFISIEKRDQRMERHERIHRRLVRTAERERRKIANLLPDGRPAPSLAALQESTRSSGPMMDDRLFSNILFVGGEEDGTATFLSCLMDHLGVPQDSISGRRPTRTTFAQAVLNAKDEAALKVAMSHASKL